MTTQKSHFTAVVFSGSTCMCRTLQHTSNECGHRHKTEAAAERCLNKLQNWSKDGKSCSATWYNGKVVERDKSGHDLIWVQSSETEYEKVSSYEVCEC